MMYWDGHTGGGWAVGMAIIMISFWGSFTVLIWVGIRALLRGPAQAGPTARQGPRDILAERFARGEIEPEEYQRRLELLGDRR